MGNSHSSIHTPVLAVLPSDAVSSPGHNDQHPEPPFWLYRYLMVSGAHSFLTSCSFRSFPSAATPNSVNSSSRSSAAKSHFIWAANQRRSQSSLRSALLLSASAMRLLLGEASSPSWTDRPICSQQQNSSWRWRVATFVTADSAVASSTCCNAGMQGSIVQKNLQPDTPHTHMDYQTGRPAA